MYRKARPDDTKLSAATSSLFSRQNRALSECLSDAFQLALKCVVTGEQVKASPSAPSYTGVFAEALMDEAARDDKIVAITAAMPSGTGLLLRES